MKKCKDFRLSEDYYITIAEKMVDHIYSDEGTDPETIEVIYDCIIFDYEYDLTSTDGYLPCIFDEYDNGEDDGSMEEFVKVAFDTFDCELLKKLAKEYEMKEYGNDSILDVYVDEYGVVMKVDWDC